MLHKTAVFQWEEDWLGFKSFFSAVILSLLFLGFVFAGRAHAGDATLAWDASTAQNLAGYKLYFGTTSKTYTASVNVGNVTTYTLTNLADGEIYYFAATAYDVYGNESDYSAELAHAVNNQPPVASAGADQSLAEGQTVILNGANSTDPEGAIVSYSWVQTGGTKVVIMNPDAATTTFVTPYVGTTGETLTFALTVTDRCGIQATDTCTVSVLRNNLAPTAEADEPQTVIEGISVILNGSKSSPDGGIAYWSWKQIQGPTVQLDGAETPQPTFVAPDVGADGETLTFQLTVTDYSGLHADDTCIVNVVNVNLPNLPPVANAGKDQNIKAGATAMLNGIASTDPDDGIVSYQWTQTSVGTTLTLSEPTAIQPTFQVPSIKKGSVLTFELTVKDRGGLTSSDTCKVTVR